MFLKQKKSIFKRGGITKITINDIPWENLTTPYGRGTNIPKLIENRKYKELVNLLEHQETLWQVTPWGVYFLLEQLKVMNRWKFMN